MGQFSIFASINDNLFFRAAERGPRAFTADLFADNGIDQATVYTRNPFVDQVRTKLKAKSSINSHQQVWSTL